jgi:hypothetical protein
MNLTRLARIIPILHRDLPSKDDLSYFRHKFRAKKCLFRAAKKRNFNEKLNDGN